MSDDYTTFDGKPFFQEPENARRPASAAIELSDMLADPNTASLSVSLNGKRYHTLTMFQLVQFICRPRFRKDQTHPLGKTLPKWYEIFVNGYIGNSFDPEMSWSFTFETTDQAIEFITREVQKCNKVEVLTYFDDDGKVLPEPRLWEGMKRTH